MALHLRIAGRVQGVGYRAAFERQATRLGLSGWVRNRHDGSVEALVAGGAAALIAIKEWAWRGPAAANVKSVAVEDVPDAEVGNQGMEILPTA
jgi:acylphosphatase